MNLDLKIRIRKTMNKQPIANVYHQKYKNFLDRIGNKLFCGNIKYSNLFCSFVSELKKDYNVQNIIKLIIGDIEVIQKHKCIYYFPNLCYKIYYENKEYKTIYLYEIDKYYSELIRVYSLISNILYADSLVDTLWAIDKYYSELIRVYSLISNILYADSLVDTLWAEDNLYIICKQKYLYDRDLTMEQDERLKESIDEYEGKAMRFSKIPEYIEILGKEVDSFMNNTFFDNQKWDFLDIFRSI